MKTSRRAFLHSLTAAASVPLLAGSGASTRANAFPVSCSTYDWVTFYQREGKVWGENIAADIAAFARTGIRAIEPNFSSVAAVTQLMPLLKRHGIMMPSAYVNSVLHKAEEAEASIALVLEIADAVARFGTTILVTNPNPVQWGKPIAKSDEELIVQSAHLETLGDELKKKGITLAYHTHDTELLAGAREFHHMLLNTSPENVRFCFDVHWVFRGSENSSVAVFDTLKLYGHRIAELHLRQSVNGIWSETFGAGDIDYQRFAGQLVDQGIKPHLVIEQCIEAASPNQYDAIEAHKKDLDAVEQVFAKVIAG